MLSEPETMTKLKQGIYQAWKPGNVKVMKLDMSGNTHKYFHKKVTIEGMLYVKNAVSLKLSV